MRALSALLLWAATAHAGRSPLVAVLPFKDLSGGNGAVGEAISETVTSDLRDVPGLRVIERGRIDQVLAELDLKAAKANLDPLATVKVGKLLSATLMVLGSYQQVGDRVRLNARFVDVETGVVAGTAKVDGLAPEFLTLQDRITVELLKSARIERMHVDRFAQRTRPKIRSLKTMQVYGDAVSEPDDQKRKQKLEQALREEPGFVYALRDLDALEKRLRELQRGSQPAEARRIAELEARLERETDGDQRSQLQIQLLSSLYTARRFHQLLAAARAIAAHPGAPATYAGAIDGGEWGAYYALMAENQLKQRDPLLRDGELFLKKFPASAWFSSVQGWMETAINDKRKAEEGTRTIAAALAKLPDTVRDQPCIRGYAFRDHAQWRDAQRSFRACLAAPGELDRAHVLLELIKADLELGEWERARQDYRILDEEKGETATYNKQWVRFAVPMDD